MARKHIANPISPFHSVPFYAYDIEYTTLSLYQKLVGPEPEPEIRTKRMFALKERKKVLYFIKCTSFNDVMRYVFIYFLPQQYNNTFSFTFFVHQCDCKFLLFSLLHGAEREICCYYSSAIYKGTEERKGTDRDML